MEEYDRMREYHDRLLGLLKFTDELCRKNDIKYTLIDGSLLGAVRHHGMIPWDADIDIALTPKELIKFYKAFDKCEGRYYLNHIPKHLFRGQQYAFNDVRAGRIVDKCCSSGVFGIDVFSIDFLGDDWAYAQETLRIYKRYSNLSRFTTAFHVPRLFIGSKLYGHGLIARVFYPILWIISRLSSPVFERFYLRFREKRIDCNREDCRYFSIEPFLGRVGVLENTILSEGYADVPFEGLTVMSVKNYDAYLIPTYGDYMTLPPEEKRVPYPSEDLLLSCRWRDE